MNYCLSFQPTISLLAFIMNSCLSLLLTFTFAEHKTPTGIIIVPSPHHHFLTPHRDNPLLNHLLHASCLAYTHTSIDVLSASRYYCRRHHHRPPLSSLMSLIIICMVLLYCADVNLKPSYHSSSLLVRFLFSSFISLFFLLHCLEALLVISLYTLHAR